MACGEVPLAEHVLQAARQQGCATLVVYSALIRVYAVARLFHKTCDLYKTLLDEGLEPDTVMSRMRAWPVWFANLSHHRTQDAGAFSLAFPVRPEASGSFS